VVAFSTASWTEWRMFVVLSAFFILLKLLMYFEPGSLELDSLLWTCTSLLETTYREWWLKGSQKFGVAAGFGRHGMPRPSVTLTFDRLTLKLVYESRLMWGTFLPNLGTLGLWVIELFAMYATVGQTDGGTKATLIARFPTVGGIIKKRSMTLWMWMPSFRMLWYYVKVYCMFLHSLFRELHTRFIKFIC